VAQTRLFGSCVIPAGDPGSARNVRPAPEFALATSAAIHSRLISTCRDPENLKYRGMDCSSQMEDRPLPTLMLSCQENFSPRRSFEGFSPVWMVLPPDLSLTRLMWRVPASRRTCYAVLRR
jgi:hypothetical protein